MFKQVLTVSALCCSLSMNADPVEVAVQQGILVGDIQSQIAAFKGIPFATPPVGSRRWKDPESPASWNGKRYATSFSPTCAQLPYPDGSMFTRPSEATSEDCLYLNVWSGNIESEKQAAVMVWIHGGALTRGSGSSSIYDGTELAKKGVVLVTINYRLGPFGYLAHPELSKESKAKSSGNYGTLDQIAALKWVQDNISQFGGDPGNVTIFGESAGSWSVNHLTASPLAAGLFQKAIGESGAKFDPMPMLSEDAYEITSAETTGQRFAKHIGAANLKEMRETTAAGVLEGFATFRARGFSQPNVDGWVFPDHIANIYRAGKQNDVALIVGSNADEGTNLMPPPKDKDQARRQFQQFGGDQAGLLIEVYEFDKDFKDATYGMFRDFIFTWNMTEWARLSSEKNPNTRLYFFSFVPPSPMEGKLGAYHAAEIRYVFNNEAITFDGTAATGEEKLLGQVMSDYWVNFAKYGTPTADGGPDWPQFSRLNPRYLEITETPRTGTRLLEKKLKAVEKVMAARWNE
jgi:para-nitrobenzyl esterase